MEVRNNVQSPYFCAKLDIKGSIPKSLSEKFSKAAADIGNENDVISLSIGRKYPKIIHYVGNGKNRSVTDYLRKTLVKSVINGEKKQRQIITCATRGRLIELNVLEEKVLDYLSMLAK